MLEADLFLLSVKASIITAIFSGPKPSYLIFSKFSPEFAEDKVFELAIDSGADECFSNEDFHEIHCEKSEIYNVKKKLETNIENFISTDIEWIPLNSTQISKDKIAEITEFLETLDNNDDVQNIYTNLKID